MAPMAANASHSRACLRRLYHVEHEQPSANHGPCARRQRSEQRRARSAFLIWQHSGLRFKRESLALHTRLRRRTTSPNTNFDDPVHFASHPRTESSFNPRQITRDIHAAGEAGERKSQAAPLGNRRRRRLTRNAAISIFKPGRASGYLAPAEARVRAGKRPAKASRDHPHSHLRSLRE